SGMAAAQSVDSKPLTFWRPLETQGLFNSYNEHPAFLKAQEVTGVRVEFIDVSSAAAPEQYNLMIASSSLPDMTCYYWNNFPGGPDLAVKNNLILRLNDDLPLYAPNYWSILSNNEEAMRLVKTDEGTHYGLVGLMTYTDSNSPVHQSAGERPLFYEASAGLIVRKDWLEDLNLDVPVTLDDWHEMLTLFKTEKGASTPLTWTSYYLDATSQFATSFGITLGLYEDEGAIKYGPIQDEYLDFLTLMHQWYEEGLLDPDYAVADNASVLARVQNGGAGAWIGGGGGFIGNPYTNVLASDPDSRYYPLPVQHPVLSESDGIVKYAYKSYPYLNYATAISAKGENVEGALKFLDYAYGAEGDMVFNFGVEGESYVMENGYPKLTDLITKNPDGNSMTAIFNKYVMLNGSMMVDYATRVIPRLNYGIPEAATCTDTWAVAQHPVQLPPTTIPTARAEEYADLYNEISTYVVEARTRFIMGLDPLQDFEAYVRRVEAMGVQDMIDIQQEALGNFYQR
ncbi:MAG TPA: extracellular solute-binding protein, partial [Clostridia bacterium]|nr:extracellular solute-binding protein [Clostridia bacterium]